MSIARLFIPVALMCSAAACTQEIPEMQAVAVVPANALALTGQVTYNERIALSSDSRLRLTVHDMSKEDKEASVIAEDVQPLDGKQIPISFTFEPDSAKFMQLKKYALRAAIIDQDERPLWTSETASIINPFAGAQEVGTLSMAKVERRPSERAAPVESGTFAYSCVPGEDVLDVDIDESRAEISFQDKSYDLPRVASASGAKYETGSRGDRVMFSSQEDMAVLEIGLAERFECELTKPEDKGSLAPGLTGGTWTVAKLREEPFVDGTKLTLTFEDGKLSGSAGCNNYFADYDVSDGTLKVGPLGMTKKMCSPEVMAQEALFSKFLASTESFKLDDEGALIIKSRVGHKLIARR